MVKAIAASIVITLFVGAGAFGQVDDIENHQEILVGINTNLLVSGPGGLGGNLVITGLEENQDATANSGETTANQSIGLLAGQGGFARTSAAGMMTIGQGLEIGTVGLSGLLDAGQNQLIGGGTEASQSQGILLGGEQSVVKAAGGAAAGLAITGAAVGADQGGDNGSTTLTEGIGVFGIQVSGLTGNANAAGTVTTGLSVLVLQSQNVE